MINIERSNTNIRVATFARIVNKLLYLPHQEVHSLLGHRVQGTWRLWVICKLQNKVSSYSPAPGQTSHRGKDSLVNKVKFLRLMHAFLISANNIQNIVCHTHSKKVQRKIFTATRKVLHNKWCYYHNFRVGGSNSNMITLQYIDRNDASCL